MRILLFDVDGTLLLTNGSGTHALGEALEAEFDISEPCVDLDFRGRTDSSLLRELLQLNGIDVTVQNVSRLSEAYGLRLPDVLHRFGGTVLPGVADLLSRLASHKHVAIYVMTGNLHETATQKLIHFGLHTHFRGIFGGDDDEDRRHLAQRTVGSLREKYGADLTNDLIVIGDTPEDVRCGEAIDAHVLAVCTGNFDRSDLEATGARVVLDDLSDVDAIFRSLVP
ncbi:MAG: HAD family hydrolase [Rubripirellula sp.]